MGKLDGKVAIITGASSGTGRATCKLFAAEGAKVVGTARRAEKLEELAAEIAGEGGEFTPVTCDMGGSSAGIKALVEKTIETYGKIDIVCNIGAATDYLRFLAKTPDDVYDYVMNVNLRGPFFLSREVLPYMIEQHHGVFVNCSSIGGIKGYAGGASYSAAKAGLIGLGRVIAAEYAYDGIRCNTVCPGTINTEMGPAITSYVDENGEVPAEGFNKRLIPYFNYLVGGEENPWCGTEPEDQAKVFLFLASDDSKYITGEEIIVAAGAVQR